MYDDEGYPVRSKLTVKLYFEGEQRELVDQWQALGTQARGLMSVDEPNKGTSWSGLCNGLENEYKNGPAEQMRSSDVLKKDLLTVP